MAQFSGTNRCPNCNTEINWKCDIYEGRREQFMGNNIENQYIYIPTILSTPQAKVHVLCFVCEECGEIFIVRKSRSTRNSYKFR